MDAKKSKRNPQQKKVRAERKALEGSKKRETPYRFAKALARSQPQAGTSQYFSRIFSKRDAHTLAWAAMVSDPFHAPIGPAPVVLAPGSVTSAPRIYPLRQTGISAANSLGYAWSGINADAWFPAANLAAGVAPQPAQIYLGNNPAVLGTATRGCPFWFTNGLYTGCPSLTGSTGMTIPGPGITSASGVAGLVFSQIPDNFISVQGSNDSTSNNNIQRFKVTCAGMRVRPIAPPAGVALVGGTIMICQQILGDNFQANPVAASSTTSIGGTDTYSYVKGQSTFVTAIAGIPTQFALPSGLMQESIAIKEMDVLTWPRDIDGHYSWNFAAAIPNNSCSFSTVTSNVNGSRAVSYPQLIMCARGLTPGTQIEIETIMVYEFYGGVSYEKNPYQSTHTVPSGHMDTAVQALKPLMSISSERRIHPGAQAGAAVVQMAADVGDIRPSNAVNWLKSGSKLVEEVTGMTTAELIGEGIGLIAGLVA